MPWRNSATIVNKLLERSLATAQSGCHRSTDDGLQCNAFEVCGRYPDDRKNSVL
jgi:hypothetical protein